MEYRKDLYMMASGVIDRRSHIEINRERQRVVRSKIREDLFQRNRIISISPTPSKKLPLREMPHQRNLESDSADQENQPSVTDKVSKRQAYLQRFLNWKATDKQKAAAMKGLNCAQPTLRNKQEMQKKRQSIYVVDKKAECAALNTVKSMKHPDLSTAFSLPLASERKPLSTSNISASKMNSNLCKPTFEFSLATASSSSIVTNPYTNHQLTQKKFFTKPTLVENQAVSLKKPVAENIKEKPSLKKPPMMFGQVQPIVETVRTIPRPNNLTSKQFKRPVPQNKVINNLSAQLSTRMKAKKPVLPNRRPNNVQKASPTKLNLLRAACELQTPNMSPAKSRRSFIVQATSTENKPNTNSSSLDNFGDISNIAPAIVAKKPNVSAAKRLLLPPSSKVFVVQKPVNNKVENKQQPKSPLKNLNYKNKSSMVTQFPTRVSVKKPELTDRKAFASGKAPFPKQDQPKSKVATPNQSRENKKHSLSSKSMTSILSNSTALNGKPHGKVPTPKTHLSEPDPVKFQDGESEISTMILNNSIQRQESIESPRKSPVRKILDSVNYFRMQLENEIKRLHFICDGWHQYSSDNEEQLQETAAKEMIDAAIGQTKLLTSKKMMQFKSLIDRCESRVTGVGAVEYDGSEDTKPVFVDDLQGWWDMLRLQSENIDKRFDELTRMKSNNWVIPEAVTTSKPKAKVQPKSKRKAAVKPSSDLKAFLQKAFAEKRKNQASEDTSEETNQPHFTPKRPSQQRVILVRDRKSFSPVRTVLRVSMGSASRPSAGVNPLLKTAILGAAEQTSREQMSSPIAKQPTSILKTPGTKKRESINRGVIFSAKKKVRRFQLTVEEGSVSGDDTIVGTDKLEDFEEDMSTERTSSSAVGEEEENAARTYALRNRLIKLRPSAEFM